MSVSHTVLLAGLVTFSSCLLVASIPQAAIAQEFNSEPLYGSASLEAGFLPDPHTVELIPGGSQSSDHLGDDCGGYIAAN